MPYSAEGKDSIILTPISQGPREQTMNSICLTTGESKGPEMYGILQVHSSRPSRLQINFLPYLTFPEIPVLFIVFHDSPLY